ncbi:quinol dehydrogenase ferredoxin subunit NapH [Solemya velum gill symbiont]|uniref:quinol dehydrogenase ferredoxin subunit NapH n=1 Tax=Solemya velum gill symbiont TaxID=2340 RepID=UPI000995EBF6|nr:quinol dehydrogenase ferredoxin subunit NapH [Solemya velum gill symbiont]OOZ15155.1 quinol dehydrogenase ferredoxin subunit NapH [Solemya velum gill symbiont]OOZ19807.1 quinol dehydrogenase ferredoxin subunit NapH [Solemya velum gill symbiont]OOZ22660.1 quinol dehydrogenase ferredoxin subunit NapH [Solemya velum gill symbiont]OOZ24702.1 quinol dehydrogenase ferredoxin subunit NapH [Solemya velum gill symbiont]OOZ29036.1 quinol dehydrogenase ferredoxin subunit NapH [Solemya velum gill symbi
MAKPFSEIGNDAIQSKGWLAAHKWLILRRVSQLGVLALFLLGPLAGIWIIKGNLSSSLLFDTVPMTEPVVFLQMLATGLVPATDAIIGVAIVAGFYFLVGGRVFCSWVCPVNMITDAAPWLRERLGIRGGARFSRNLRYWMLGMVLLLSAVTGTMAYEMFNPVSILHRGIIFGVGLAWSVVIAIFLFDFLVAKRGWCTHLCPMGGLYSVIGRYSLLKIAADKREACNDCMDCFIVCPEPQVIKPALKGAKKGLSPVILASECTNCGRCIDVCSEDVFSFGTRFNKYEKLGSEIGSAQKV